MTQNRPRVTPTIRTAAASRAAYSVATLAALALMAAAAQATIPVKHPMQAPRPAASSRPPRLKGRTDKQGRATQSRSL